MKQRALLIMAVAASGLMGGSKNAAAQSYGYPTQPLLVEEPLATISIGPSVGVPIGDHGAENNPGLGVTLQGTFRIKHRFSFAARAAFIDEPIDDYGIEAQPRKMTFLNAGIHYFVPTPKRGQLTIAGMIGRHTSTPEVGDVEAGFGAYVQIGLAFQLSQLLGVTGGVGYSHSLTTRESPRGTIDYVFEIIDFTVAAQLRL